MNRNHLRSLPTLPPAGPEVPQSAASEAAQAELAEHFAGLLARGERDEEAPDYELLEAAVDGGLDPLEAELFASRLAGDPVLQREFDDLVALRGQLQRKVGSPLPLRRWMGFAAAAVLLAAVGLGLRPETHRGESVAAAATSPADIVQSGPEVLFADSFEGGSAEHWSN